MRYPGMCFIWESEVLYIFNEERRRVCWISQWKKATIHQLVSMLSTSKNILFPSHNHLLTTSADDSTL